jgi:hypothetical protein
VRLLRGTRRECRAGEARVLALVLGHVGRPRRLDRTKIVVAQPAALPERQAKVHELGFIPADADAEDESPAGGLVHRGRRLRRHQGAAVRQHDHARAQTDPARAAREKREQRERIGPVAAVVLSRGRLGKDVIGDEDPVQAQGFRAERQRFGIGHRELPDREHDAIVHGVPT